MGVEREKEPEEMVFRRDAGAEKPQNRVQEVAKGWSLRGRRQLEQEVRQLELEVEKRWRLLEQEVLWQR